jgi:hypothetical protein
MTREKEVESIESFSRAWSGADNSPSFERLRDSLGTGERRRTPKF